MKKRMNRFLVVDAAEGASGQFSRIAGRLGFKTRAATSLAAFVASLEKFAPSVVMLDLQSAESWGIEHLKALREADSHAHVILVSNGNQRELDTTKQLAEFLGMPVVACSRPTAVSDVVRNELQKVKFQNMGVTVDDLRAALADGKLQYFYQARSSFDRKEIDAIPEVEVVPQWQVAKSKAIMANDVYWLAESGGLTGDLTTSVLQQAVKQLAAWQKRKIAVRIVVQLPLAAMLGEGFPQRVLGMMQVEKLDTSLLTLEFSEADIPNCSASVLNATGELKTMGFKLGIDEFGSSYSSLEQLCRLDVDEIKIDRMLVAESSRSAEARKIIEAIVTLGHSFGSSVCADGVDSQRTLQLVGKIGCNAAQGNVVCHLLPANEVEGQIAEWRGRAVAS